MDLELTGKRALVTGGSSGIGRAVAAALVGEGVDVAIAARTPAKLDAAVADLRAGSSRRVVGIEVDTTDDASVRSMVSAASEALGGVDILVNCAARVGGAPAPLLELTDEEVWIDLNTKVMGYLRCARAAAPGMIAGGWGRIINVSGLGARMTGSISGSIRNVGVVAMTKNLADQLGPHGINANVVHPGATRTEGYVAMQGTASRTRDNEPFPNTIQRMVSAPEVASLVAFLASPRSVAVNGEAIACGGGTPGVIHY